jgi:hypothetical protein
MPRPIQPIEAMSGAERVAKALTLLLVTIVVGVILAAVTAASLFVLVTALNRALGD